MVVTMPAEASHASMRRRRAGAGSGVMARPLRETVRRALLCTPPSARNNRRESRERAVQQTNYRYSRCGDSATSARAKCGHRVLPPFVRFSAVFDGRARSHCSLCIGSSTRTHAPLLLAPGTRGASSAQRCCTRGSPHNLCITLPYVLSYPSSPLNN